MNTEFQQPENAICKSMRMHFVFKTLKGDHNNKFLEFQRKNAKHIFLLKPNKLLKLKSKMIKSRNNRGTTSSKLYYIQYYLIKGLFSLQILVYIRKY